MIGIERLISGTNTSFPAKWLYRSSLGLMQIAESPRIVSGLVVAI